MIEQTIIAVFGIASVWLSQDPAARCRRWAPVIGLLAQPAWLYATWTAGQWGIFALSIVYTAAWSRGIWHQWVRA